MKILENVVPMDNQTFPFVSCFTSWLIALGKSSLTMDKLKKRHQNLYRLYMPVTGSGLAALWNESEPTLDTCYCTGEDYYLEWAMQFAGYQYEKVENNKSNRTVFTEAIKKAIEADEPIMAQSLIGTSWCLITGYDDSMDTLYGWHQREWGITQNPADGYLENGMFLKSDWYSSVQAIVIKKEKIKEKLNSADVLSHFVSVMENTKVEDYYVGQAAFQKCFDTLSNDSVYENIDDTTLHQIYKEVFFFCTTFAESRAFTGSTIETSEFKKKINADNQVMGLLNMASIPCRASHKLVWEIWAVLGNNYEYEPDLYAERLKDKAVRNKLIELIKQIQKNDLEALSYFKHI